jgi:hypothetical protein
LRISSCIASRSASLNCISLIVSINNDVFRNANISVNVLNAIDITYGIRFLQSEIENSVL